MYDDELAYTGIGTIGIGGFVFDAMWLLAVGFLLVAAGLILTRVGKSDA